ncbi:MAG: DUF4253 domain-containing protein [Pirellulaceae bacterium]
MYDLLSDPSPLIRAIGNGDLEAVVELLDRGHPVDEVDSHGRSALMCAVWEYNPDLVQLLVERGADVNFQSPTGARPLLAHPNLMVKITKMLLRAGADPQASGVTGAPVIAEIASNSTKRVLKACFDSGVRLEIDAQTREKLLKKLRSERSANLKLVLEHLGLDESPHEKPPAARTRELAEAAESPDFIKVAEKVGQIFRRKGTAWKRRAGVLRFHQTSLAARLAAYYGEAPPRDSESDQAGVLFRKFAREIEDEGFLLIRNDFLFEDHCTLLLFPTFDKYVALRSIGTNGNNFGHDTRDVIEWLQKMEERNPFRLLAATHDGMEGEFLNEVQGPMELAKDMLEFCPELALESAELADISEFADELKTERTFGFWWD